MWRGPPPAVPPDRRCPTGSSAIIAGHLVVGGEVARPADVDRDERADHHTVHVVAGGEQQVPERAGDHRQHDVVDGPTEAATDLLDLVEAGAGRRPPPVRADSALDGQRRSGNGLVAAGSASPLHACPSTDLREVARRGASSLRSPSCSAGRSASWSERIDRERRVARLRPWQSTRRGSGGDGSGLGSRSSTIKSVPETPSTMQWWTLEISAHRPSAEALDHPRLPQRPVTVELHRHQPAHQVVELLRRHRAAAARCGARGTRG